MHDTTENVAERAEEIARYMVEKGATIRDCAKVFAVSKSTVFVDLTIRLPSYNSELAKQANAVMQKNKAEMRIRGSRAFSEKCKKNKH